MIVVINIYLLKNQFDIIDLLNSCRLLNHKKLLPLIKMCIIPHMPGLQNMECSEEDIYTIAGYDFDWKLVGRRLLGNQKVTDIDLEGSSEGDTREKVLLEWKKTKSRDATYQALVKVLRTVQNNATADSVEALEKSKSQGNKISPSHLHV